MTVFILWSLSEEIHFKTESDENETHRSTEGKYSAQCSAGVKKKWICKSKIRPRGIDDLANESTVLETSSFTSHRLILDYRSVTKSRRPSWQSPPWKALDKTSTNQNSGMKRSKPIWIRAVQGWSSPHLAFYRAETFTWWFSLSIFLFQFCPASVDVVWENPTHSSSFVIHSITRINPSPHPSESTPCNIYAKTCNTLFWKELNSPPVHITLSKHSLSRCGDQGSMLEPILGWEDSRNGELIPGPIEQYQQQ
jgi:hypothetical protein